MLSLLVWVLVVLVVVGFLLWVVESAPFISATMKPMLRWLLIVVAGFICIALLLKLVGVVNFPLGAIAPFADDGRRALPI